MEVWNKNIITRDGTSTVFTEYESSVSTGCLKLRTSMSIALQYSRDTGSTKLPDSNLDSNTSPGLKSSISDYYRT
jgi:hypothetical protein